MKKQIMINGQLATLESIGQTIKATVIVERHATAAGFRDGLLAKGFERKQLKVMRRYDGQWMVLLTCTVQQVLKLAA